MGQSLVTAAENTATNIASGTSGANEALTGTAGSGYRGVQTRSQSGKSCQRWDAQTPHSHSYTPAAYPDAGLTDNYCRNPDGVGPTIWCYTNDPSQTWESCQPIGVIQ